MQEDKKQHQHEEEKFEKKHIGLTIKTGLRAGKLEYDFSSNPNKPPTTN